MKGKSVTSFISDKSLSWILKNAIIHLLCAIFCLFFGAIYEAFSFGVYSIYMIYAFCIPLLLGAIPLFSLALWGKKFPGRFALNAWNSGIAALTVGCIVKGVLDIYGTTNRLIIVYPIAAAILLLAGLISYVFQKW